MTIVNANSSTARPISAAREGGRSLPSPHSCAMTEAMLSPGWNRCEVILWFEPITSATCDRLSPTRARASPAPTSFSCGPWEHRTRSISHRVAPIASAAFLSSCATVASTSRLIDVTIGMIITASTRPAVKKLAPLAWPPRKRPSPGTCRSCCDVLVGCASPAARARPGLQSVHDRRDRREQVDDVDHGLAQAAGRELGREERDTEAQWHREHDGDRRGDDRSVDERQRAELVVRRVPRAARHEPEAVGAKDRPGLLGHDNQIRAGIASGRDGRHQGDRKIGRPRRRSSAACPS